MQQRLIKVKSTIDVGTKIANLQKINIRYNADTQKIAFTEDSRAERRLEDEKDSERRSEEAIVGVKQRERIKLDLKMRSGRYFEHSGKSGSELG